MPAQVILVEAQPARAADGIAETIRLAGGGALAPYTYSGQTDWRSGVVGLPTLIASLEYEGGEFPAGSVPAAAAIEWAPSNKALLSATASYVWADAPITVRIGSEGAALPPVRISGKVLDAKASGGKLTIALADPATSLKKPLLTARFAGTGGLEGPAEWDGQIRRRVWGRIWNLSGDPLDAANNIYCYADPLRPLQAFDAVRDKGAPAAALTTLAWQGSAAATFAALQAATVPAGGGVACPSIACVKWWTQPAGELCADLRGEVGSGYVETTAGIAQLLVEAIGGPAFTAGSVSAASAARPAPVGWVAKDDTSTVAAMLDELLGNSSLLWLLDDNGAITIREWAWGASVASATSQDVSREQVLRPLATRKLGYKRNETPMQRGDLAAIVLSSEVAYLDGTSIEALKPAQPGATAGATVGGDLRLTDGNIPNQAQVITAEGTAAAIAGQGYFATQNFADWATRISGLGKPQDNATWGAISGVNLRNNADTAYLGDLDIITAAGTAAAITGQGPGATAVAGAVMNYAVGLGQNVLTNSAFENGSYGWEPGWDNYASFTPEHGVGLPGYAGALSTAYTRVLGTPPAGVFDSYTPSGGNPKRWWLPVSGGDRVFASALVAYHRLAYAPDLKVGWYDASGAYLTESVAASGGRNNGANGGEPGNFDRVGGFVLAPVNARYARLWIRGATDGGQTEPYLFYTQMMLCRVPADQSAWPVYHDGGADLFANVTGENTAAAISGQGPLATAPSASPYVNANISIGANGALIGAGGGSVTIGGLGYLGDLDATRGARVGLNLRNSADTAYLGDADVVTAAGTAAAIAGQGALATQSSLAYGGAYLTGFGGLAGLASVNFGSSTLLETSGGAQATLGNFKTALGTAAAFTGQSAWATYSGLVPSNVAGQVQHLQTDGNIQSLHVYKPGVALLSDVWPAEAGANVTESRTAAALAGQSAWATYNGLDPSNVAGQVQYLQTDGYLQALRVYKPGVAFLNDVWPAEAGANVTESRTAAAISGQGPFATTPLPVSRLTKIKPNLFPYPFGVDDGRNAAQIGWSNTAATAGFSEFGMGRNAYFDGGYYQTNRSSGAATTLYPYYDMAWDGGSAAVSVGLNGYSVNGTFNPYVEFLNASNTYLGYAGLTYNAATERFEANGVTTPASTAFIRVVVSSSFSATSGTYQDIVCWGIKVERGPNATPIMETPRQRVSGDQVEWATGGKLNALRPAEFGSNVTENRAAAAIAGQGYFATQNYAGASRLLVSGYDNIVPDGDYRDPSWWGFSGLPNVGFLAMDSYWEQNRSISFTCDRDFDFSSAYFNIEPGSVYRVRTRIWNNDAGAGWTGNFWALIHMPNVAWWSLKHGAAVNADVGGSANAISAIGDTGVQEFYFRATSNTMRNIQFRFKSTARGSRVDLQVMISKVPQLGKDLIKSGTATKYLVSEIETGLGTAAAIAGQGAGATANNLAQLDATAAAQLTTAYNGGVQSAAYGETIKRKIGPGGTLGLSALVNCDAGGVSGSIRARIDSRPYGGSWSTVATGAGSATGPSEPGGDSTSGTFTNSTGIEQVFEFRVIEVRTPSGAGGAILASQSYVTG